MKQAAFELPGLSLVRVAGADSIKVLNGLCTAKLVELSAGQATEAMFTDDRGRVLVHAIIARETDQPITWILGQFAEPAKLVAHIDRFIFREDAQPKDQSASWHAWLLDLSEDAWPQLARQLGLDVAVGMAGLAIEGHEGWLVRLPMTSPEARVLLLPAAAQALGPGWLEQHGLPLAASDELEDRRIRNFWPQAPFEMNERTLPQELDRDARAISFTKGCYLGQETVARLDAMGEVQKKLCLVEIYGSPNGVVTEQLAGQALVKDGKEVGKLHSVSPLQHDGKHFALASMRRGSMAAGSQFTIVLPETVPAPTGTVIAHP
jgi:folate-binding protein YgfZ